jgi:dihydrofolate reductase
MDALARPKFVTRRLSIPASLARRPGAGAEKRRRQQRRHFMRKVTAGLFHSVDGVVEAPYNFQFDSFDDELGAELGKVMGATDAVILGRVGYLDWAGYWPETREDQGFAQFINSVPKYVASRTLKGELTWTNAKLIAGDVVEFVRALKQQPGKDIAVMASTTLLRHLFFAGLVDELTLITHPVVAGKGRHLFEPADPTTRLELKRATVTSKGNVLQTYGLRA